MSRQLIISVTADFVCPWCYIGHVHLTRALDKVKGSANVKLVHEPYSVYDQPMRTPPKGQLVIEYLSDVYGIDRSHLEDPKFNASLATARTLGISFSWDRRVTDSTLAHRAVLSLQDRLTVEEMSALLTKIYHSYFEEARDIGDSRVLQEIIAERINFSSAATAVPWRTVIEGVPLIELRSAEGCALAKLEGEDVECDKIVDQIKRICLTESSSFIMPTE